MSDAAFQWLVERAQTDEEVIGVVEYGAHAFGTATANSDIDALYIVTEDRLNQLPEHQQIFEAPDGTPIDLTLHTLRTLAAKAVEPGWWSYAYAHSRVLLDKTGEVGAAVQVVRQPTPETAERLAREALRPYVRLLARSLRAAEQGDELGTRLHCAESVPHLIRLLFSLEGHWTPYWDHLRHDLHKLSPQGWREGEVQELLLSLLTAGTPGTQRRVARTVFNLAAERGLRDMLESYGHALTDLVGEQET